MHHSTAILPGSLANDEAKVYEAIVLRFIAAFYPPCVKQITTVLGETRQVQFKTTGTIIESPGWQVLYKNDSPGQQGNEVKILPNFAQGETGPHQPSINQGKTTPPKHITKPVYWVSWNQPGKPVMMKNSRKH